MSEPKKTVKKKKRWGKIYEYTPTTRASVLTKDLVKEIEGEIKKTNSLTPQYLAKKHNIKVSLAKKILERMTQKGTLEKSYSKSKNVIYTK